MNQNANIAIKKKSPRYAQLAEQLIAEIEHGTYPVGYFLPSEHELTRHFGVSRHTARSAIQKLKDLGMVKTQHGKGSQVVSVKPLMTGVSFSFDSLNDFLRIAEETTLKIISTENRTVGSKISKVTGWRPEDHCLYLTTTRTTDKKQGGTNNIAYIELYLHGRYKKIAPKIGQRRYAVARQIEQEFGQHIRELKQSIKPILLGKAAAAALKMKADTLGLEVSRIYYGDDNEVLYFVISHQAGDEAIVNLRMRYE